MGNTAGGHVVIGVDDDRTVPGLADPLKDEEALARAITDSIESLLPVEISVQHAGAVNVLVAEALRRKGPFGIKSEGEKGFYKRVGSTNRPYRLCADRLTDLGRDLRRPPGDPESGLLRLRLHRRDNQARHQPGTQPCHRPDTARVAPDGDPRIGYERISTTFDDGYPEPDWRELGVVVRVTIPTHPYFTDGNEGSREGDEGDREGDEGDRLVDGPSMSAAQRAAWVLAEIDADRPVTNQYLARALGVSLATVERLTRRMQKDKTIRWSGTRRSGNFQRI
jgi:predicted HTH transcriptional regulator